LRGLFRRDSISRPNQEGPSHTNRFVAFYLPQFHPIAENDRWWGTGFTDWRPVARATPLFPGHLQPQIPADLGFYDLRLPESRIAQAELASSFGIDAFCYWHYWFEGKRLLQRPFEEVLRSGEPDFPFCLAWANEPWSRTWLGRQQDVLMQQTYSEADDRQHAAWLVKAFADARYLRIDERPVFLVYSPGDHPRLQSFAATLRQSVVAAGLKDPFMIGVNSHSAKDWRPFGFDANLKFEPQLGALPGALDDALGPEFFKERNKRLGLDDCGLRLYDYEEARTLMKQYPSPRPAIPCVLVGFDNSPRRGTKGVILINNSPAAFGRALRDTIESAATGARASELIFINAWNEWAEGNHLEPDLLGGHDHLEAVRAVKRDLMHSQV
jgi:lipopolysaccharide biosynthesis protein